MENPIDLDAAYAPSEDVVAREIEGEIIIVPLTSGMGDMEDELYTLNDTGRAIWMKLDGLRPLRALVSELAAEFDAPAEVIEQDAVGLLEELARRKMVVRKR
ncbi:MAG: PqqD family protein [Candidatus Aminicenantales bacterium]